MELRANRVLVVVLSLSVVMVMGQNDPDKDGKPDRWDELTRSQLAPELRPPTQDVMEVVKDSIDRHHIPSSIGTFMNFNTILMNAIPKMIIDHAEPTFKLPPGVSVPIGAIGPGHMTMGNGIPNAEKNHMSGVQRDAILAGASTLRFQSQNGDGFGTRQHEDHIRKPMYAEYLQHMMNTYATGIPGYGIGTVPLNILKALAPVNPMIPFGPGPLGSGSDFLGQANIQMVREIDENSNTLRPFNFHPRVFQPDEHGFSAPQAIVGQLGNELRNMYPQALAYATSVSANPMTGVQPVFM